MADRNKTVPVFHAGGAASEAELLIVHMVTGQTARGEDFYAYVAVKPSRYEEFLALSARSAPMNIEEFGDVLMKGFGKGPPQNVRAVMKEEFGVDHDFVDNLCKELEAAGKERPVEYFAQKILKWRAEKK